MTDILNTGKSALFAFQRALATTSHNIANVNTEGYSRQRVDLEAVPGNTGLYRQAGQGVRVVGIERLEDQFATARLNSATSAHAAQNTLYSMASRLDNLIASDASSIAPAINDFFNAVQDANVDPSSMASREVLLDKSEQLAAKFQNLQAQFADTQTEGNERFREAVSSVDKLASSIAQVNKQIIASGNSRGRESTNDLRDQRDRLVQELSSLIDVKTAEQANGALNVYAAKGISLVVDAQSQRVSAVADDFAPERLTIQVGSGNSALKIAGELQGGQIGGLTEFASNTLQPAMAELGRLALSLTDTLNQQHASGLDLNGDKGGALFSVPDPLVIANSNNNGTGTISAQIDDSRALAASNYQLRFDGTQYSATRESDGKTTTGSLPMTLDGITLSLNGTPQAGDKFTISATGQAAGNMRSLITSADRLALSGQLATSSSISNIGDSRISSAIITDPENSNLETPVDIVFTSPGSYDIVNGSNTILASNASYVEGDTIALNGWQVSISGTIEAGDTHRVQPNTSGQGNNSNGLAIADLQESLAVGGNQSFNDAYGSLVARIGSQTNSALSRAEALEALKNNALDRQQAIQGVSLDEEAIDLTRYQQAYQASAQIIATADEMFQTILGAVR